MNRIILILVSVVFFACNEAKNETKDEVVERKVEQVIERYPDGKKKVEGEMVNGERHGVWKYYHKNGFLWSEGKFWYGERKGYAIIYFDNGRIKMEGNYAKDLKVGIWKLWNPDGSLNREIDLNKMLNATDSVKLELKPALN